jgi:hypothetical protein
MRQEWLGLLRDLPVSINNLADPSILRLSTEAKLNQLVSDRHTGPVAIIKSGLLRAPVIPHNFNLKSVSLLQRRTRYLGCLKSWLNLLHNQGITGNFML